MNLIQNLERAIITLRRNARTLLERPLHDDGVWSLDIREANNLVIVEWRNGEPFYLSTDREASYGEGGDEAFDTIEEVEQRIAELLSTGEHTVVPIGSLLSCARERDCLTQSEMAERLHVKQATISGIEHRHDIQISTLKRYLRALNSPFEVRISARFLVLRSVVEKGRRQKAVTAQTKMDAFPCLSKAGKLSKANDDACKVSQSGLLMEFA